jgi:hypothetical protein
MNINVYFIVCGAAPVDRSRVREFIEG